MFFVLSSGRSGSRTIATALNSFSNCTCFHHPEPELVIEATQYYYGEYPEEQVAEVLRSTRVKKSINKIYGEVNLQLSLLVPVIEKVFPSAKYIWLIRDGRDVVASMYYRGWFDPDDPKVPEEWKKGRLQGDRTGDFPLQEWEQMNRFEKCCWLWKKYNLVIETHIHSLDSGRWMKVRLDRLKTTMPQIAKFLDLRGERKVLVEKLNIAYQPVRYWEGWDEEMRKSFELICGADMDRWFPEWRTDKGVWRKIDTEQPDEAGLSLRLKRWFAGLPVKARANAGALKQRIFGRCNCA
ncbi:MAG: hypothetical protein HY761_04910 [Candidatus Omnitrophica bacterium]|nr:hypothetical protein [Candidatus Omnitrophota bacterium]